VLGAVVAGAPSHAEDSVPDSRTIVLEHVKSVLIANFIKKDFLKHVKHLDGSAGGGLLPEGGGPVLYSDGPAVVEGIYDVITSNKKYPFSATCGGVVTDSGALKDLIMCNLLVETDAGGKAKVEMFYGLKNGKIDRVIMGKVRAENPDGSTASAEPAGQN
jgi:hypothetical protein